MKHTILILSIITFLITGKTFAQAEQEKLDLPGDNLNLYATLKLFQESETLEGFEKALNEESSQINNLDLNGDDNTDYIKVNDQVEDGVHYISLKVAVNENEDQDVAVFIVDKDKDGQVQIQLIGDEDLYGKDYIIEPGSETSDNGGSTPNPGYTPNNQQNVVVRNNVSYQIDTWPVIRYIFVPNYIIWHSPWHWNYYPSYWHPWRPQYWHYYYGYHYNLHNYYNVHYRRSVVYRNPVWRQRYYSGGMRSSSVYVINRNQRGDYKKTYSRPGSAKEGFGASRKKNPNLSTGRNRLPSFDKTGRPVINKPVTSRPSVTRPGRENTTTPRPVTTPGNARPGNGNTSPTRPVTRPGNENPSPTRPVTRPAVSRPATSRPSVSRPDNGSSRQNAAKPATSRPAGRERTPR
ncbi:hypothetical protein [Dyadobacter sp. NIV53]|uniref:hypothetical protein n=1 Tax=Dyadobacter sp. NIV53 TaxID=2861765 RepID=UPI001C8745A1|nr:hypothetical protein [Dyadobacter sp. NIV53]